MVCQSLHQLYPRQVRFRRFQQPTSLTNRSIDPGPKRALASAVSSLWNDLPEHVKLSPSLASFKTALKTHLMKGCIIVLYPVHCLVLCLSCKYYLVYVTCAMSVFRWILVHYKNFLFRTNYYSIEILHGVTAIILTYHPHHAKLQVLPYKNSLLLLLLLTTTKHYVHSPDRRIDSQNRRFFS